MTRKTLLPLRKPGYGKNNSERKIMRLGKFKGQEITGWRSQGRHLEMQVMIPGESLEFEISIESEKNEIIDKSGILSEKRSSRMAAKRF